MVDVQEYESLRQRPDGLLVMYHKWRDLSFLHFPIDPAELRPTVPAELDIDTFPDASGREMAWVGLVPFWMTGVRLRGLPAAPGFSTFPETNLRTYVHRNGKKPGVWFYSLDAANRLACFAARKTFGLPYFWANMRVNRSPGKILYESVRNGTPRAISKISVSIGEEALHIQPGSLEFFLVERYLLYSNRNGEILTGQVHHKPYPIQTAKVLSSRESMTEADNVPSRPWQHVLYSPGVDVEVYAVRK